MVAIPEFLESEVGECIGARTLSLPTFRELGPPDLVAVSKQHPKSAKEDGTYHYVSGHDVSSAASAAAYLNTLAFTLGENQLWFGRHPQWKVHAGTYCSYNAFSKLDMRVAAQIPGTVEAFAVDDRGERRKITDRLWTETYMSAMARAMILTDDDVYYVSCCRKINPIPLSKKQAGRFFDAFETLFYSGPKLGCSSEIQIPTLVSNHLITTFLKFVQITGLYDRGLESLEKFQESDPEVSSLVAQLLLLKNEEVQAVQQMHAGVLANHRDANLLVLQSKFCLKKGNSDLALDTAIRAVNAAPAEFDPWEQLVRVYIERKDHELALLTLNSCPMFAFHEMDVQRMPPPAKIHYPLPEDGVLDEIWAVNETADNEQDHCDPGLLKLPASSLRSTFLKAYDLLTTIVSEIGWDQLLKFRSNVFVMEEEYHSEKKRPNMASSKINLTASHKNIPSPTDENADGQLENGDAHVGNGTTNGTNETTVDANKDDDKLQEKIKNKRLCERWLDNLFMVLYEDLRVYTVWRAGYVKYQNDQMQYNKPALEWEILGMVALRLKHTAEAADAFEHAMKLKFSHRVLWKLLDSYEKNNSPELINTIVKLIAWQHRWYSDFSPKLILALKSLVQKEGITKIRSSVRAAYSPQGVVSLVEDLLRIFEEYIDNPEDK